ncbi:MAG: class II aldolase/adducin family protein [Patescibacteria group bacterium]|jgi:L-fuculose-phosphate aldolase
MVYPGVKFKTEFIKKQAPQDPRIIELIKWCQDFHQSNLAPVYDGCSAGNLSFRLKEGENIFIITGAGLKAKEDLTNQSFVKIFNCDFERKIIQAEGVMEPSSETMLHFALYQKRVEVNAIFHGHCQQILAQAKKLNIPQTKKEAPYGSLELVRQALSILENNNFLVLKNHGFIALGKDMTEAGQLALAFQKKCC